MQSPMPSLVIAFMIVWFEKVMEKGYYHNCSVLLLITQGKTLNHPYNPVRKV